MDRRTFLVLTAASTTSIAGPALAQLTSGRPIRLIIPLAVGGAPDSYARLIAEHMAVAHREVAPVTWVEECDFEAVDLRLLVPTVLKACALSLQAYRGRAFSLPRVAASSPHR